MNTEQKQGPFLNHLDEIESRCAKGDLTLQDIFDIFGPEGHFILILFLVFPFLQPIPLPGLSTLFGILIAIVACLRYIHKPPWLPKRWAQKRLPAQNVLKIAESSERIFRKLKFLKPRMQLFLSEPFHGINILLLAVNALFLALPLPVPFSNAIPAWTIAIQTLAYLEDDGALIFLSYVGCTLCVAFFGVLGVKALSFI